MAKVSTVYRVGSLHLSEGVNFNLKIVKQSSKFDMGFQSENCQNLILKQSSKFNMGLQVYGTSKKSVPEFGGSTPNLGETHEDGKVGPYPAKQKLFQFEFLTKPF